MGKKLAIGAIGLATVATVMLVATGWPTQMRSAVEERRPTLRSVSEPSRIVAPGRVEPFSGEIELAANQLGVIRKVYVNERNRIRRNDLVAELENVDFQARVEQAEVTIRIRRAQLDKLQNGARPEERRQAAMRLQEMEAALTLAQQQLNRQQKLFRIGATSVESLDQAESTNRIAVARRAAAAEALALLEIGPRPEDVIIANTELALAQAQLAEAREVLERTRVRSPIDGTVLQVYKHPGEAVTSQPLTPIMEVGNLERLRVRAQIDQADIARVTVGQCAYATALGYPGQQFEGRISELSPRLGAKTIIRDAPTEKRDTRVQDALIDLDDGISLPVGLRVEVFIFLQPSAPKVSSNTTDQREMTLPSFARICADQTSLR